MGRHSYQGPAERPPTLIEVFEVVTFTRTTEYNLGGVSTAQTVSYPDIMRRFADADATFAATMETLAHDSDQRWATHQRTRRGNRQE